MAAAVKAAEAAERPPTRSCPAAHKALPNVIEGGAPAGGEQDFVVLKHVGEPPTFDFEPKDHLELGEGLARSTWSAAQRCPAPGSTSCAASAPSCSGRC